MKRTQQQPERPSKRTSLKGKQLSVREITKKELADWKELAGRFHYMGEGHPAGDTMRLVVECEGEWLGLFLWGSAAYRLKDRDAWIGWNPAQQAQRQKLVVQNRRFVMLGEQGASPNLASRMLGLVIRELPEMWEKKFGYQPLLAETFSDIEARAGTCYKAAGWLALGESRGYSRHRADYFVPNDRPKKIWVKPLRPNAVKGLRAPEVPAECAKGAGSDADGVMPVNVGKIDSLQDWLRRVRDPRAGNTVFRIDSMLLIITLAIFSGHRNLVQIVRFGNRMTLRQREAVGLPRYRKDSRYRKVPSYSAFYNLLRQMDVDEFARVLNDWLAHHEGSLPAALALDGKFIRETVGLVCMVDHETGAPHAMGKASQKEGEGQDCELKAGQRLIRERKELNNKVITADALHLQADTARDILERGGEYILQAKGNQKTTRREAEVLTSDLSPFLPGP